MIAEAAASSWETTIWVDDRDVQGLSAFSLPFEETLAVSCWIRRLVRLRAWAFHENGGDAVWSCPFRGPDG